MAKATDSQLREPGLESCAAMLNVRRVFTVHYSSSLNCISEYMAIDSGGYLCTNSIRA